METISQAEYRALLKKLPATTEHDEQVAFVHWCAVYAGQCPHLAYVAAVPNGGKRHISVAMKLKAEGVRAGYPDLLLDVAAHGFHGWRCELKIGTGTVQDTQQAWHARLRAQGYAIDVCYGWEAAARALCGYLGLITQEFGL